MKIYIIIIPGTQTNSAHHEIPAEQPLCTCHSHEDPTQINIVMQQKSQNINGGI